MTIDTLTPQMTRLLAEAVKSARSNARRKKLPYSPSLARHVRRLFFEQRGR